MRTRGVHAHRIRARRIFLVPDCMFYCCANRNTTFRFMLVYRIEFAPQAEIVMAGPSSKIISSALRTVLGELLSGASFPKSCSRERQRKFAGAKLRCMGAPIHPSNHQQCFRAWRSPRPGRSFAPYLLLLLFVHLPVRVLGSRWPKAVRELSGGKRASPLDEGQLATLSLRCPFTLGRFSSVCIRLCC